MIVKRIIVVVAFVIFALPIILLTSCTKVIGPTKVEIIDSVRHYLPVVLGDDVNMLWVIKNVGDQTLVIKDIQPSNGSIELASIEYGLIPPGEEERILTIFHSAKNVGFAEHKIRIFGNIEPDGVAMVRFDINIVRPTLDRTDYEEIFFDNEVRYESEAFKKARLNKAYYTDADSLDFIDVPSVEDTTQFDRNIRGLFHRSELKSNQNISNSNNNKGTTINYKDFEIGEKDGKYKDAIFFSPQKTNIYNDNIIDEIVIWYNNHPGKTIYLKGFADKETGNAKLNLQLANQRIKNIADLLTRKGVAVNKIKSQAYGDSVQPFTENSRNRCVIVSIE